MKKKAFTLIELIAVIAILAVLMAVLVPKISGYKKSARASNYKTAASEILNSIKAYNSDRGTIEAIGTSNSVEDAISMINAEAGKNVYDTNAYEYYKLKELKVGQLVNVAKGNFKIKADDTLDVVDAGALE